MVSYSQVYYSADVGNYNWHIYMGFSVYTVRT